MPLCSRLDGSWFCWSFMAHTWPICWPCHDDTNSRLLN